MAIVHSSSFALTGKLVAKLATRAGTGLNLDHLNPLVEVAKNLVPEKPQTHGYARYVIALPFCITAKKKIPTTLASNRT